MIYPRRLFALTFLCMGMAGSGLALDPRLPLSHFTVQAFTQANGLPQDYISDITQDSVGYLWLATQEGLVRFDGVRFIVINRRSTPALPQDFTVSLLSRKDGGIWVGMRGGLISLLGQKRGLELTETLSGLQGSWVQTLMTDREGVLWAGGRSGGVVRRIRGEDGESLLQPVEGFRTTRVFDLLQDAEGCIWIATEDRGIGCLDKGRLRWLNKATGLPGNNVRALTLDRTGALWAAIYGGGLAKIVNGRVSGSFGKTDGLPSLSLQTILIDREGNLWVGAEDSGIGRFREKAGYDPTHRDRLSRPSIETIFEDREGNLWLGSSGEGLLRLGDSLFTVIDERNGLYSQPSCVLEDRHHQLWVGADNGLYRLEEAPGHLLVAQTIAALDGIPVTSLFEGSRGELWIGSYEHGVARLQGQQLHWWRKKDGLPSESIWAIEGDGEDGVWLGTYGGGAVHLKGNSVEIIDHSSGLKNTIIRALHRDRQGRIWLGTGGGGFATLDADGKLRVNPYSSRLDSAGVLDFLEDDRGDMWFATGGSGLCRLSEGSIRCLGIDEGLYDNTIFRLLPDAGGHLWMSCNRGIFSASFETLRSVFDGQADTVECRVFGRADGMPSPECNGGNQPSGWLDHLGRMWFPSPKGLVGVDTSQLPAPPPPPRVLIETLRADGRNYDVHQDLRLPPGTRFVEVDFTALTLVSPEMVDFRYRLQGLTHQWTKIGARRTIYLTTLPPGDFRLEVEARRFQGEWGTPCIPLNFRISPQWHEILWVRVILGFSLLLGVVLLFLAKIRTHRRREQELQQRIDAATRELAVANSRLRELSLEDPLTGIGNRRRFDQLLDLVWEHALRSKQEVSLIMIDIDNFKKYNDAMGHPAGDDCLRKVAASISGLVRRSSDLLARYGGEEFVVLLPNTNLEFATEMAEDIRMEIERLQLPHASSAGGVITISLGLASCLPTPGNTAEELIQSADEALYQAKRMGRNRVEVARGSHPV